MTTRHFLNPGELYFGGGAVQVETLLGSCVAVVLWFAGGRQGGICHFQLPGQDRPLQVNRALDGRYGLDAWLWLGKQARLHGLRVEQAQLKVFGGACSLLAEQRLDIGAQNIAFVEQLFAAKGLTAAASDLGGVGSRYLHFELASGAVWVRRGAALMVPSGARN